MNPKFFVLSDAYQYGSEFYGAEQDYVITPITERCFLTIWQASRIFKGCLINGKSCSGKTQTCRVSIYIKKVMMDKKTNTKLIF